MNINFPMMMMMMMIIIIIIQINISRGHYWFFHHVFHDVTNTERNPKKWKVCYSRLWPKCERLLISICCYIRGPCSTQYMNYRVDTAKWCLPLGRSVGIVRSRTKGHGVCFFFCLMLTTRWKKKPLLETNSVSDKRKSFRVQNRTLLHT
jgi:hypothetical protein